jgi:hypothetical protein
MWMCQAARLFLKHGFFQGCGLHDMSHTVQIIEDTQGLVSPLFDPTKHDARHYSIKRTQ